MSNNAGKLKEKLAAWLSAKRPNAENLQISDFSSPEAGASNETLLFDVEWQQSDAQHHQALVARLQPTVAGVFPEYDLAKQYRAMELLQGTGVPVPRLEGFEADAGVLGTPFYLMERLEGIVITENPPYYMEGWFLESTPQQQGDIWRNGIRAAAHVHRQDWQKLGFSWLLQPELGETPLQQQLAYYERFLEWTERRGQPYPKLRATLHWLLARQPKNEPVALCWGDAKAANLLIDGTEVSAVLDWEMVHLGNPVDDLAWWFTLDNSMSEGLELLVGMEIPKAPGIPAPQELIELWERESGFSARDLDYYEVFGALKFGIIMASVGIKYTREGLVPADMEMDIKNTSTTLLDRLMHANNI